MRIWFCTKMNKHNSHHYNKDFEEHSKGIPINPDAISMTSKSHDKSWGSPWHFTRVPTFTILPNSRSVHTVLLLSESVKFWWLYHKKKHPKGRRRRHHHQHLRSGNRVREGSKRRLSRPAFSPYYTMPPIRVQSSTACKWKLTTNVSFFILKDSDGPLTITFFLRLPIVLHAVHQARSLCLSLSLVY